MIYKTEISRIFYEDEEQVRLPQNFGDESFKKMHTFKIKEDLKE
jgi:hypothetical protein